jgi:CheY-like chemotaxis protein
LFHGLKKQPPAAELFDWRIVMLNQKETDDLIRQMAERIKELERFEALVELAGTMAHDFNNILGGIYGYADLALENCSEEKIKRYLEKTVKTIERMRTLTQQLSSLSQGIIPVEQTFIAPDVLTVSNGIKPGLSGSKGKILVLDDEIFMLDVLSSMLEELDYKPVTAKHGAEAVEIYNKETATGAPFELLLLDLTIKGGIGGAETLEKIKHINPSVKAIAISGYSNDPVLAAPWQFGFAGILKKPFVISDLKHVIQELLYTDNLSNPQGK